MSIPDKVTAPATTPQVITTSAVSEHVLQWASDAARDVFIHSDNLLKVIVSVAAAGMASGIRFQYRFATNAALTGTPITVGDSGIILPADLAAGDSHEFRIRPVPLPLGYDFSGGWFALESEAATTGFAVFMDLRDKPDRTNIVYAAP